ncbi:hypothetical protein V6N13_118784 [Hibiscus sabdariffa]
MATSHRPCRQQQPHGVSFSPFLQPSLYRASSASRFSGRKRNEKGWTECNVIEEGDYGEYFYGKDKGLTRRCQILMGVLGFIVSVTVHNFYFGEGARSSKQDAYNALFIKDDIEEVLSTKKESSNCSSDSPWISLVLWLFTPTVASLSSLKTVHANTTELEMVCFGCLKSLSKLLVIGKCGSNNCLENSKDQLE